MHWVFLSLAIGLEVMGTTCMKLSAGFTRWVPSVLMMLFYLGSLGALTMALRRIDVGMAYAVWSGLGTALIATIGIWWFGEPAGALKMASLTLIILGVVGLHASGGTHSTDQRPTPAMQHGVAEAP